MRIGIVGALSALTAEQQRAVQHLRRHLKPTTDTVISDGDTVPVDGIDVLVVLPAETHRPIVTTPLWRTQDYAVARGKSVYVLWPDGKVQGIEEGQPPPPPEVVS